MLPVSMIAAVSSSILMFGSVNCEEIVQTLKDYQEYSTQSGMPITDEDIQRLAGRCSKYLELQEEGDGREDK